MRTLQGIVKGNAISTCADVSAWEGRKVVITLAPSADVSEQEAKRKKAFSDLMKYAGSVKREVDCEKELEKAREERYERYKNLD